VQAGERERGLDAELKMMVDGLLKTGLPPMAVAKNLMCQAADRATPMADRVRVMIPDTGESERFADLYRKIVRRKQTLSTKANGPVEYSSVADMQGFVAARPFPTSPDEVGTCVCMRIMFAQRKNAFKFLHRCRDYYGNAVL
jgi:hypothetical protein